MKKVLSLVLVLTLVLGSFSMAFAAETTETNLSDIAGNANEGAIVVANDLGIVTGYPDGTFKPTNSVTRAEFAAMMTRALAIPESALKGFKTSAFKDVPADHWAVTYLGYCNSKGIMTGYEDGSARPNQTITVNEAMTMICRALGYTNQAKELVGAWPANYIALGQQLSLYDDVEAVATTDRASAAQIIYNALTVPLKYINADGTTVNMKDGNNNDVTMLGSNGGSEENDGCGFVLTSQKADNAVINVSEYVGQFVKAFVDKSGNIIAVDVLSTTVSGKYKLADAVLAGSDVDYLFNPTNGAFQYNAEALVAGKVTKTPTVPDGIEQGKTVSSAAFTVPNGLGVGYLVDNASYTMAVKLNGRTIQEVYSVQVWTAADMDQFEADDLNAAKCKINVAGTNYDFKPDKNGDIDMSSFALLGVTSLDKIAEDNVIEVYTDGKYITKLAVGTKTVKGTVTEVNKKGDRFYIDGVKFATADLYSGADPAVGESGTAYLNYDGDIAYWDVDDATAGNYAVFLGARESDGTTIAKGTTMVGLVLKDGTVKELETAKGVVGTPGAVNSIVKYAINAKGKISELTLVPNASVITPAAVSINANKTALGSKSFASNLIVFIKDGDDWSLGKVEDFSSKYEINDTNSYWAMDDKGKNIAAMWVDIAVKGTNDSYGVINEVFYGDKDGDSYYYVNGYIDGVKVTKKWTDIANRNDAISGAAFDTFGTGSLYKLSVDADGVIEGPVLSATLVTSATGKTTTQIDTTGKYPQIKVTNASVENTYLLTKDAKVYFYDEDADEVYTAVSISNIGKGKEIILMRTDADLNDENLYDVVFIRNAK